MENKLDWFSKIKQIDHHEKITYFLQYLDEAPINLSSILRDEFRKIQEIQEIYKNDLVFIIVEDYTGSEVLGIYSYKQKKVVFPFIIREYSHDKETGFIYLELMESRLANENFMDLNLNPDNDFAYLYNDGSVVQNEGIIEKVLDMDYFLLQDVPRHSSFSNWTYDGTFKLFSHNFDRDDNIGLHGIVAYDYDSETKILKADVKDAENGVKEIVMELK